MPIVALALVLAACSCAPDYSGCRLIGTWTYEPSNGEKITGSEDSDGTHTTALIQGGAPIASDRVECFLADGTWCMHQIGTAAPLLTVSWRLRHDSGDRVEIEFGLERKDGYLSMREFVFDSPDVMRDGDTRDIRVMGAK